MDAPSPNDPSLRVVIDRTRWQALAPAFWEEANRRLRANGLPSAKFQKNPGKPVPVHPSLGGGTLHPLLGGGRRLAG